MVDRVVVQDVQQRSFGPDVVDGPCFRRNPPVSDGVTGPVRHSPEASMPTSVLSHDWGKVIAVEVGLRTSHQMGSVECQC